MQPSSPTRPTLLVLGFAVVLAVVSGRPQGSLSVDRLESSAVSRGAPEGLGDGLVTLAAARPPGEETLDAAPVGRAEAGVPLPATPIVGERISPAPLGAAPDTETQAAPSTRVRPQVITYTVKEGETLSEIALRYGIHLSTILAANDLVDADFVQAGQKLSIFTVDGVLHRVQAGESLWEISQRFGVAMEEIIWANDISDPAHLEVQQQLFIPGVRAPLPDQYALLDASGRLRRGFSWPVRGRITSRFGTRWGRMHEGIDIGVNMGTPVKAAADGKVTYSGWGNGYGYLVILDHGNGIETRYGHNSRVIARPGARVRRGEVVAYSGNTGHSTGPHLHFEIRRYGRPVDPTQYLLR
ncbi:MAG TPA: peptidoglycan DD-metalloendopeptidase family protein [Limnochordia bacterium]